MTDKPRGTLELIKISLANRQGALTSWNSSQASRVARSAQLTLATIDNRPVELPPPEEPIRNRLQGINSANTVARVLDRNPGPSVMIPQPQIFTRMFNILHVINA